MIVVDQNRVRWITQNHSNCLSCFYSVDPFLQLIEHLSVTCYTMPHNIHVQWTTINPDAVCHLFLKHKPFWPSRSVLLQQQRNLEDMRDMAASRASLSGLCLESPNESRITSPDATTNGKFTTQKSYDSMSETVGLNLITEH